MTKEVEDIIRNKAYYELSSDERASVSEFAQNEEEYNNMQWFLTGTTAAFGAAKIEASPGLKKGVMEHLTEGKKKKGFWLNSLGVFMLPTNKRFYQKPAFQLGIAAVLIAGLLFTLNPGVTDNGLAFNDAENESPLELNETVEPLPIINEDQKSEDLDDKAFVNEQADEQEFELYERDEIAVLEEESDELIMDLAPPAPESLADSPNDMEMNSVVTFAAPLVQDVTVMDAEEEVALDFYIDDEVAEAAEVEEKVKPDMDKDVSLNNEITTEGFLDKKENRRDNTALRSLSQKKKGVAQENKLIETAPGAAEGSTDVTVTTGNNNASGYIESGEWIKPKALHINKTKELNALFFIEK